MSFYFEIFVLSFENDRLKEIVSSGYGIDRIKTGETVSAQAGDSKAYIFLKYGRPTETRVHTKEETNTRYTQDNDFLCAHHRTVFVEFAEWTYDSDPNRLPRRLFFKNNRLVDIE